MSSNGTVTYFSKSWSDRIYRLIVYLFLFLFAFLCLFPFYIVVLNSFTPEPVIAGNGYQIFPSRLTLDAYSYLMRGPQLARSYSVTITIVVFGTLLATIITAMFAYTIAHPRVKHRNILAFITYFAMLFGRPLVGFYMMIVNLMGIKNTLWALTLPYLINPFFVFILVASFREFPFELSESAQIDGASDMRIFFVIAIPITLPSIVTIALFYALLFWNDWWLSLLFIDVDRLHPLQMMLRQLISQVNATRYVAGNVNLGPLPSNSLRMAVVCMTIGPILLVYPFIQRFFVKGISLGAVKG